jgi:hypothetical protein
LRQQLARGELVDLRPTKGTRADAEAGGTWGTRRIVEASILTTLLTVGAGDQQWTHHPLRLAGARITGHLDLEAATLNRSLLLEDCYFEQPITLTDAHTADIELKGCRLPGLEGERLETHGDLDLHDGFKAAGKVNLDGAQIDGDLTCDGKFTNERGAAFEGSSLAVGKDMYCLGEFGEVSLVSAQIGGNLYLLGKFSNEGGTAFDGSSLAVGKDMFCVGEFAATGEINLFSAQIGGELMCGGTFSNEGLGKEPEDGFVAFGGTGLVVGKNMSFINDLLAMEFAADARSAMTGELAAREILLARAWAATRGFAATGRVNLSGAQIGGLLACGGTFSNEGRVAFAGTGLVVGKDMVIDDFAATGEVGLVLGRIGGELICDGTFSNEGGTALNGGRLVVSGSMRFDSNFAATGSIDLSQARIGGELLLYGKFNHQGIAIGLERAEIGGRITLKPTSFDGFLDLELATAAGWHDSAADVPSTSTAALHRIRGRHQSPLTVTEGTLTERRVTWPAKGRLWLRGFSYNEIRSYPQTTVRQRLEWLRRDVEGFIPQPYEQLATVYQREGNEADARKVLISAQWRRRLPPEKSWSSRLRGSLRFIWSVLLWATVGYGYRPWLIVFPLGLLYGVGVPLFAHAHPGEFKSPNSVPSGVEFNSWIYTADLLIPGASFGERARFLATDWAQWLAATYTVAGWMLAAMLIAGLTGVFRRL